MRIEFKRDRVSMSKNEYRQVMNELNQYKQAYQHCVDDLIVLRANNKRLERENRNLKNENKAILSKSNSYFDKWQNEQTTSRGLREQCKEYAKDASKYLYLTEHIRLKAEVNPSVDRYIDLVNYIDKLEG